MAFENQLDIPKTPISDQMNWKNLKDNNCPVCKSGLQYYASNRLYKCPSGDFIITEIKFDEIINNLYKTRREYQFETEGMLDDTQ